jgi:NADH:ubiquinone oxidoreductase subunit 4 (subunit M)
MLGSRQRKIHATYFLIIYTFLGSLFLLTTIVLLDVYFGTANIEIIISMPLFQNMGNLGIVFFLLLFFGFFVKIPLFPLHLWLLEAHVEAHTTTSVILAALILKLGGIGMWKFMVPFALLNVNLSVYISYLVCFVILGLIITSVAMVQQVDLKKFVAYSSIIHMSFSIIALLQFNESGLAGFILSMFAHGFSSAGLFFCVGMLYERFGSRNSLVYSGLSTILPLFSFSFFIFLLCNASFPFTINFLGEVLCFIGLQEKNFFLGLFLIFFAIGYCFYESLGWCSYFIWKQSVA